MKKLGLLVLLIFLLTGCSAQETFETISDDVLQSAMAPMGQISITLPEDAAVPSMDNDEAGKIYLCDGYTVTVQTLSGGDLNATLRNVTGYEKDRLTVIQTELSGICRYDCAWSTVGEGGDWVARTTVLDDGNYHYAVSVMAESSVAGEQAEAWQTVLDSVCLSND